MLDFANGPALMVKIPTNHRVLEHAQPVENTREYDRQDTVEERAAIKDAFGAGALAAFNRHAQAIAQLSEDIREAFAQHKAKIDAMDRAAQARDEKIEALEADLRSLRFQAGPQ